MNTLQRFTSAAGAVIAAALLTCSASLRASPAKVETPAAGTNAPAVKVVPKAVFDITAKGIKDPFFPQTSRSPVATEAAAPPPINASTFELKGLSGQGNQRLALINNRTLAEGESADLVTARGKLRVHCVKIGDASVVIRVDKQTDPIELRLRKGF